MYTLVHRKSLIKLSRVKIDGKKKGESGSKVRWGLNQLRVRQIALTRYTGSLSPVRFTPCTSVVLKHAHATCVYEVVKLNCKASFKYTIDGLKLSFNAHCLLYHAPPCQRARAYAVTDRMRGDRERITTFKSSVLRSGPCARHRVLVIFHFIDCYRTKRIDFFFFF